MEKKYMVWIAVLVVAVIGVLAVSSLMGEEEYAAPSLTENGAPGTENGLPAEQEEYVVTYTDEGFSPSVTNIEQGETVTFRNESDRSLWVASAPHPQHTDYPEFDMKEGKPRGGTYSFVFDKAGEWKFHNHLFPSHFGTINVQ